MVPSQEPDDDEARDPHGVHALCFLLLAKEELGDSEYKDIVVKAVHEMAKKSENPQGGGITVQECQDILSELLVGRTRLLNCLHHFLQGRHPFHDEQPLDPFSFLAKVKASPHIFNKDYDDIISALVQYAKRDITIEDLNEKVETILAPCPDFLQIFQLFSPAYLREPVAIEQPCGNPKHSQMGKAVLSCTPDANSNLDAIRVKATNISNNVCQLEYPRDQNHDRTDYHFGNGESLHAEEYEGDKIDPLPDWSPSRENELPSKVNPSICMPCTPSYCRLPEDCLTLQSSYWTKLGRSIFNDTLVSVASGTEDCFKFRTKNKYEENIITCEDDMFESDMLLQRFRATADFIGNLQDCVDKDMKIQEHLTPIHRRCIEMLYDDYGIELLDSLLETQNTSATLAVLHSRLNKKIEDLSVARLSLHERCSSIIAKNHNRSLDYCSSSFKQLDAKRLTPKALLSEAKEINMKRSITGVDHLSSSSCNGQYRFVSDDAHNSIDLHIHDDIDSIVSYASHKKNSSEHKAMMIWMQLVRPFVSADCCQLQELNSTVAPKEACERCGLSEKSLKSILGVSLAENFPLSSKTGECLGNASSKSASIHDGSKVEIEEGELVPCIENIRVGTMLRHVNKAACNDVAAPSGDGSCLQYLESSIYDDDNKAEVQHESRECSNVEMGSLVYTKKVTEQHDVKGTKTCCSLVVLCRLHQILYERLLFAKILSREESAKAVSRGSHKFDLYAKFKGKLFKLLSGSTDNSSFEAHCLNFLGPRSYLLFTLDKLIWQVINQLRGICEDKNLLLQLDNKMRRAGLSNDSRSSPARPSTNGSLEQDPEVGGKGRKLHDKGRTFHDNTVEPAKKHFHRRQKRKIESLSPPGVDTKKTHEKLV